MYLAEITYNVSNVRGRCLGAYSEN